METMPMQPSKTDEQKWQAESDVRTLIDAEKIKADKPRLRRAMKMAKEQADALKNVQK